MKTKKKYLENGVKMAVLSTKMDLLGITDVSTPRQEKNGTIVWKLPIKINYPGNAEKFIEVASFKTGYVRNQNCGYSNYQLNKRCEGEPQYYPEYKWCDDKDCNVKTGKYHMFQTRACVLIPNEIDRLEYLIAYCLKNYYIKHANHVPNGQFISKWEHEYKLERANSTYSENTGAMERVTDLEDKIYELTSKVDVGEEYTINLKAQLSLKCDHYQNLLREKNDMLFSYEQTLDSNKKLESKVRDLENKLATIERIARINASYR